MTSSAAKLFVVRLPLRFSAGLVIAAAGVLSASTDLLVSPGRFVGVAFDAVVAAPASALAEPSLYSNLASSTGTSYLTLLTVLLMVAFRGVFTWEKAIIRPSIFR